MSNFSFFLIFKFFNFFQIFIFSNQFQISTFWNKKNSAKNFFSNSNFFQIFQFFRINFKISNFFSSIFHIEISNFKIFKISNFLEYGEFLAVDDVLVQIFLHLSVGENGVDVVLPFADVDVALVVDLPKQNFINSNFWLILIHQLMAINNSWHSKNDNFIK